MQSDASENDNSAYLHLLIMSLDPYFYRTVTLKHLTYFNSAWQYSRTSQYGVSMQKLQFCLSLFSKYVPLLIFYLLFLFLERNPETFQNIFILLSGIIEQVTIKCHVQE